MQNSQMKKCLLFILFNCCFFLVFSQKQKREWAMETRFKSGFLLGHRPVMGHLAVEHAFAGEVSYIIRTRGQKKWHSAYKFPDIGITTYFGSAGNRDILGNYLGAYSFVSFPFISRDKFRFNGKLGAGLGLGFRQYDPVSNQKNVAMSTPLNAMICLGIDAKYYFKKNWISLGIDMTHFSNGAFKVPNLGLNLPFLSVGYGRFIQQVDTVSQLKPTYMPLRKILIGATAILSAKEIFPTGGTKYPVYALSIHARTFLKPRVGWELSADFISKQAIFGYRPQIEKTQKEIFQIGIYAGYLLPLDRFHFVLGMGYYVKDKFQPEDAMYHRVGFRYYLNNGIQFNIVLKSHWARADYVEWGIGYSFNTKKAKS
mgnify:CR=1 FL=1